MIMLTAHGGGCCGMRHVWGFSQVTNSPNNPSVKTKLDSVPKGRLTEVVLTKNQVLTLPHTMQKLADDGFVLVGGFRNSNSGNNCYVFHRCDYRVSLEGLDKCWKGQTVSVTENALPPSCPFRRLRKILRLLFRRKTLLFS